MIVVAICLVAVTIYKKGNVSISNSISDYDELVSQFNNVKLTMYENATTSGAQIIELLKSLEEEYQKRKITKTKELKNWSDYKQKDYKFIVNEYSSENSKYWNLCELIVYKNSEIITSLKTNYSKLNN